MQRILWPLPKRWYAGRQAFHRRKFASIFCQCPEDMLNQTDKDDERELKATGICTTM